MSLDVATLDENGYPTNEVPIGVDEHFRLMQLVEALSLPLLLRTKDYYQDVEFSVGEVNQLLAEINILAGEYSNDPELHTIVSRLRELAETAKGQSTKIVVIAD